MYLPYQVLELEENTHCRFNCAFCGKTLEVVVKTKGYQEWRSISRRSIQEIFHYLSKETCELFISGVCDDCFKKL